MSIFTQKLKAWRNGRTYREVADILECDHTMVYYLETGHRSPGPRLRRALKKYANIDVAVTRKTTVSIQVL